MSVFGNLVRGKRAQFQDTFAEYVRSKQDDQLDSIEIPNSRFWDKVFIANLFITHGRVVTSVDTTTFKDRVSVITKDGEYWSANFRPAEETSLYELKLQAQDIAELDALDK